MGGPCGMAFPLAFLPVFRFRPPLLNLRMPTIHPLILLCLLLLPLHLVRLYDYSVVPVVRFCPLCSSCAPLEISAFLISCGFPQRSRSARYDRPAPSPSLSILLVAQRTALALEVGCVRGWGTVFRSRGFRRNRDLQVKYASPRWVSRFSKVS